MRTVEYDEEEALKSYVWRNYPDIMRPHECVPSPEEICDRLPPELREDYRKYAVECQEIISRVRSESETRLSAGCTMDVSPMLPEMSPELSAAVAPVIRVLESEGFWRKFKAHESQVSIARVWGTRQS